MHALTGENGSGKSTLARVINGSVQPDAGTIIVEGRQQQVKDPRAALRLGIVTISQELTLAPTLSVAENIFLGRLPRQPRARRLAAPAPAGRPRCSTASTCT